MKKMTKRIIVALGLIWAVGSVQADLLISESFNYAVGGRLADVGSGTGWGTNKWIGTTGGGLFIEEGSLSVPDGVELFPVANRVRNDTQTIGRRSTRFFEEDIDLGTTLYASFLFRWEEGGRFDIQTRNESHIRLSVGVDTDGTFWTARDNTGTKSETAAGTVEANTVYFVLLKNTGTAVQAALFEVGVDTVPDDESEITWLTNLEQTTGVSQDRLVITIGAGPAITELDELRLGTTFESVTVEPEPPPLPDPNLVLKDSFDYTVGDRLDGIGSGIGWGTNEWTGITNGGQFIGAGSLSMPEGVELFPEGNHIRNSSFAAHRQSVRYFEEDISLGTTLYSSFLFRWEDGGRFRIETRNDAGHYRLSVGVDTDGSFWTARDQTAGTTKSFAEDPVEEGATYFVLLKNTGTTVQAALFEVGVDTVPDDESEIIWLTNSSQTTAVSQNRMIITIGAGPAITELDEFRLGKTFESVTVEPPPPGMEPEQEPVLGPHFILGGSFDEAELDPAWKMTHGTPSTVSPGLDDGSEQALHIQPGDQVLQSIGKTGGDWQVSFLFNSGVLTSANQRSMNVFFRHQKNDDLQLNLRLVYQSASQGQLQVFSEMFRTLSIGALDYGTTYKVVVTGRDYGTPDARYEVSVYEGESFDQLVGKQIRIAWWQNEDPVVPGFSGIEQIVFSGRYSQAEYFVDQVSVQAGSVAQIHSYLTVEDQMPALSFLGHEGSAYTLQYTTDLTSDPVVWSPVQGAQSIPGTGSRMWLEDSAPEDPVRFYRIAAE